MEKKFRVLIVHNYYRISGGEDSVVLNEINLLKKYGHKVYFYHRNNNELEGANLIKKIIFAFAYFFNPKTYFELNRLIKQKRIDIVHVHNTLMMISPSVYYAALSCKIPIVQTIHNYRLLCPGATLYRNGHICEECIKKGICNSLKYCCYKNSHVFTCLSAINTIIHRKIGIYKRINFVFLTQFNKEKFLEANQKFGFLDDKKLFVKPNFTFNKTIKFKKIASKRYLYVGRIEEIKGIDLLINAFIKMPERQLYLAGDGPLLNRYKYLIEKKGCNNIVFWGQINHNKVLMAMKNSNAVILPSQVYEGFPMIIPEAFSMHTPVIVSDIGNSGILVEEGITGTKFQYNSVCALREAIIRLENLNYELLCDNAYKAYAMEYSSDENYKRLMYIYSHAK